MLRRTELFRVRIDCVSKLSGRAEGGGGGGGGGGEGVKSVLSGNLVPRVLEEERLRRNEVASMVPQCDKTHKI